MSDLIIYNTEDGKSKVSLFVQENEVWLTQNQLAELFDTSVQNIGMHMKNIIKDKELDEISVIKDFFITAADGKNYSVKHYSLAMILAVGFRVRSPRGTQFRRWANTSLRTYLEKGFLMDDERLKNPNGRVDHFDELLERIRDIRASEMRFYQKVRELFKLSSDYDACDKATEMFFAEAQNKLIYAVTQQTAAELICHRANAELPNMGLTTWSGERVRKADIIVSKNYLNEDEIDTLNRLTVIFLESAELRAKNRQDLTLRFWQNRIDSIIEDNGFPVLADKGNKSRQQMKEFTDEQYALFKQKRREILALNAEQDDLNTLEAIGKKVKQTR
ncbi:virulence RhuM family protein [Actinobacillus equuli]|uniref:virulence RhuM family protein n=1 Tax=Actinobacillus equuli TaxID=718 RepID=UPI002441BDB3|nr:virulence RhuM family protein [Actinobacillus equuli]WGE42094.1 virulence RhuM family protein [Actinobacillus equuli subsp. haemolyticus]